MPTPLLTVKKDGAERLWKYILAYRKMMLNRQPRSKELLAKNNVSFIVAPTVERAKTNPTTIKT